MAWGSTEVRSKNYVWDVQTLDWVRECPTEPGAASTVVASTQVAVSNFPTQSTDISVSNFPTQSTQVSIGNQPTVTVAGYVAPSTQVSVSGYVAPSTTVAVSNFPAASTQVSVSGYVAPSTMVSIANIPHVIVDSMPAGGSGLTDAELRATAVPVSGTFWPATQPVSVASLPSHPVSLLDSTGQSLESSTRCNAASTMRGLAVRSIQPDCTYVSGASSAAGDLTLVAATTQAVYVYAFAVTKYSSVANVLRLMNGSTSLAWYLNHSGINGGWTGSTGAPTLAPFTLSVSPPAYLFKTSTGNALILSRSSSGHFSYGVAAWRE